MKVKLHFVYQDDTEDEMVISGELKELQKIAQHEAKKRNVKDAWSEIIDQ